MHLTDRKKKKRIGGGGGGGAVVATERERDSGATGVNGQRFKSGVSFCFLFGFFFFFFFVCVCDLGALARLL